MPDPLRQLLSQHRDHGIPNEAICSCGWTSQDQQHTDHVTDIVTDLLDLTRGCPSAGYCPHEAYEDA